MVEGRCEESFGRKTIGALGKNGKGSIDGEVIGVLGKNGRGSMNSIGALGKNGQGPTLLERVSFGKLG